MIHTSWVKPVPEIIGLDHLGVQAPCINLYGQILPGITNVTDRAYYYAFYPWVLHEHEQQRGTLTRDALISTLRRADCLATLVGIHHAATTDHNERRHGLRMVGRDRLFPAYEKAAETGKPISLASFAVLTEAPTRYFKNPYGGLAQYYLGVLRDLEILSGTTGQLIKYVRGRGDDLAAAFGAGVEADQFFTYLSRDAIRVEELDELVKFCPCQLTENPLLSEELVDLFFDRKKRYGDQGNRRRQSLALILHLVRELNLLWDGGGGAPLGVDLFRATVYSGALGGATPWDVPPVLESARHKWERYQRNELLSVAMQGIFWTGLVWLQDQPELLPNSEALREHFPQAFATLALRERADWSFEKAVENAHETLPDLMDWENPTHEIQLARILPEAGKYRNSLDGQARLLRHAVDILIALVARHGGSENPYRLFVHESGYFEDYPLNLQALQLKAMGSWKQLSLRELLGWWVTHWGVDVHLRVALRKLRGQVQDSFQVRPTDGGLIVKRAPEPIHTTPRFLQAVQILGDLNLLELDGSGSRASITGAGRAVLEEVLGG